MKKLKAIGLIIVMAVMFIVACNGNNPVSYAVTWIVPSEVSITVNGNEVSAGDFEEGTVIVFAGRIPASNAVTVTVNDIPVMPIRTGNTFTHTITVTEATSVFITFTPIESASNLLNGTYRLILDGTPQIVLDAAHAAGNAARTPAPAAASAIRVAWDAVPNAPIVPIMTQLRTGGRARR